MEFIEEIVKNGERSEFKAKPFWSLNGKLEKDELSRQIDVLKKMGFGGAFLHSRTGLKTEYMGEEWLDDLEFCVEELEKREMESWLYDEDRWPSGTCGGTVAKKEGEQAEIHCLRYFRLFRRQKFRQAEEVYRFIFGFVRRRSPCFV